MKKLLSRSVVAVSVALATVLVAGCVVEERVPPTRCAGGYWVEGHRGRLGHWHRGHWRCPGVVEVVEVD